VNGRRAPRWKKKDPSLLHQGAPSLKMVSKKEEGKRVTYGKKREHKSPDH